MMKRLMLAAILVACGVSAQPLDELTRLPQFKSMRASSSNEDLNRNGDARSIKAGETLELANLEGPGIVTHIWCTVGSEDVFYPRSLVVRMYWDGSDKPSVQAPLGDFFGIGHGAFAEFSSAPVCNTSGGRARACFWKMPFKKSARITVTNDNDQVECDSFYFYVDWQKYESLPEDTGYFHAEYRQAAPAVPGDYVILDTTGRGQYVGVVYSVHQMENGWFGEGDDRFWIDGESAPSLKGTGTEDYFNDAWGFRKFATPYYGVPFWEGYYAGDRLTAYRWHITDPVAFQKSLRVTIEHRGSIFTNSLLELGGFFERRDWISSVAYWYQSPPCGIETPMPPLAERLPPYKVILAKDMTIRTDPELPTIKQNTGVLYAPLKPNGSIEFDFEVAQEGRYVLQAILSHALVGGVYQPMLDGKPFGPVLDLVADGMDVLPERLDQQILTAGKHTLRFEGRGISPKTRNLTPRLCAFGMHSLILLRLQDMKGFQETMDQVMKDRANPPVK